MRVRSLAIPALRTRRACLPASPAGRACLREESKTCRTGFATALREAFTLFLRAVPCPQALARRLLLDARAGDVVLCAANMKTKGAHGMDGTAVVTGGAGGIGKRLAIYHNDHGWTLNPASEK